MSISDTTALELERGTQSGDTAAVRAAEASLARTKAMEPSIHVFVTIDEEKTMEQAGKVQTDIEAERLKGLLAGVPVAIKDNMCTKGIRTICSFRILGNSIPTYAAQVVSNLEQIGVVVLGKTNMDEFTTGSTTETSASGVTRNPWNLEHVPGGSSGGSHVAVAVEECFYALGSGTGGSIRQLSSFCSVAGIKPTYGAVSGYRLVAYGSSLDQIGPVAKDVPDCAAVLEIPASYGPKGSTSMERRDCDFTSVLLEDIRGVRIGIPESYFGQGLDQGVKGAVLEAARVLGEKGAIVETFDLKPAEYAIPTYYVIASTEASSNLFRFDGIKYGYRASEYEGLHSIYKKSRSLGFGPKVRRRIMLGSFVLSSGYYDAYYLEALRIKALVKKEFNRALVSYDVILMPATPSTAPWLSWPPGDPLKVYPGDIYATSMNLVGFPGASLPCDLDSEGFPIELQLIGDRFKEKSITRAAYAYGRTRKWKLLLLAAGKAKEPSSALTGRAKRKSHE